VPQPLQALCLSFIHVVANLLVSFFSALRSFRGKQRLPFGTLLILKHQPRHAFHKSGRIPSVALQNMRPSRTMQLTRLPEWRDTNCDIDVVSKWAGLSTTHEIIGPYSTTEARYSERRALLPSMNQTFNAAALNLWYALGAKRTSRCSQLTVFRTTITLVTFGMVTCRRLRNLNPPTSLIPRSTAVPCSASFSARLTRFGTAQTPRVAQICQRGAARAFAP
jgi:hypothetical protein